MEIKIISAQEGINPYTYIEKVNLQDFESIYIYPERDIYHPKTLYEKMINKTTENILRNKSMLIITFSDHVLNAVRVSVKKTSFKNAKCIQMLKNEKIIEAEILPTGQITDWAEGIFDVYDKALLTLLDV